MGRCVVWTRGCAGAGPLVTLRERLFRGEINIPEWEGRLDGLLRSDPIESMPGCAPTPRAEPRRRNRWAGTATPTSRSG